jgi:hypothetical protein
MNLLDKLKGAIRVGSSAVLGIVWCLVILGLGLWVKGCLDIWNYCGHIYWWEWGMSLGVICAVIAAYNVTFHDESCGEKSETQIPDAVPKWGVEGRGKSQGDSMTGKTLLDSPDRSAAKGSANNSQNKSKDGQSLLHGVVKMPNGQKLSHRRLAALTAKRN